MFIQALNELILNVLHLYETLNTFKIFNITKASMK